jgi:predicted helicase
MLPQNSKRVVEQKKAPIRIIIGNPPYSVGQKSANDNAQNLSYGKLEKRIEETYAKNSEANLRKALYDSYIKAFRWSSDRLSKEHGGIIAFISNGGWLDANAMDGFRKCIEEEFSGIYVFNLRGNQRTSGDLSRREGGKIFGSGSRTPVTITILVKNPQREKSKAEINYYDIGDYLTRENKLEIIKDFKDIENIKFKKITPNEHGDWINKRSNEFEEHTPLAPEKSSIRIQRVFLWRIH